MRGVFLIRMGSFLLLVGCAAPEPVVLAPLAAGEALEVDLVARVATPGSPAAWTARAGWLAGVSSASPPIGMCRRPSDATPPRGTRRADSLAITGPIDATLIWQEAQGVYSVEGPRQAPDPAWAVGDLRWVDDAGRAHLAESAVRFGALPEITRVVRDREGAVELAWDPGTVRDPEIRVRGPGGELVCGAGAAGTTLPWWSVPAFGGEVVLRTTHLQAGTIDGVQVRVRSTIERVVPLDRPEGTTAEEEPGTPARRPAPLPPPRRLTRPGRVTVG